VFSMLCGQGCYKQDKLGAVSCVQRRGFESAPRLSVFQLVLKLPFGNLEVGEHPPLEAATKQRLVKAVTD
jgi:hypothetical protein